MCHIRVRIISLGVICSELPITDEEIETQDDFALTHILILATFRRI
jgi:hypothetical protein